MSAVPGLRKKVKPSGRIELDPIEPALLIDIETQIVKTSEDGKETIAERKQSWIKVLLKTFAPESNIGEVAAEVIAQCKYIQATKGPVIEALLKDLQSRLVMGTPAILSKGMQPQSEPSAKSDRKPRAIPEPVVAAVKEAKFEPSARERTEFRREKKMVASADNRIEAASSAIAPAEVATKLKQEMNVAEANQESSASVAHLRKLDKQRSKAARKREQELYQTNMPKEKASMDKLDQYLEMLYEDNPDEIVKATYLILQLVQNPYNIEEFCSNPTTLGALARILAENRKKNTELVTNVLEIFFCFSNYSELHRILIESKIGDTTMRVIDLECKRYDLHAEGLANGTTTSDINAERFLAKQEKLLFVCFWILLNLAEDLQIEVKMVNRGIVKYLVKALDRAPNQRELCIELQLLTVTFLKKLSIFKENTSAMLALGVVGKLSGLIVSATSATMTMAATRLLFNVSFDRGAREEIMRLKVILPLIVKELKSTDANSRQVALRLLYNLSLDGCSRGEIIAAGTIPEVCDLLLQAQRRLVNPELIGLAVNLSAHPTSSSIMGDKDMLQQLFRRVHHTSDPLVMKLLNNLSSHPGKGKENLTRYIPELVGMAKRATQNEFLVEILGVLGNLNTPGVTWSRILEQNSDFLELIVKQLVPGFTDDDIVLAAIVLLGTIPSDPRAMPLLANSRLISLMVDTLIEKSDDEEIALQCVFAIYRFLLHDDTRPFVLVRSDLTERLMVLQRSDPNSKIRSTAAQCVETIKEFSPNDYREKVKDLEFKAFNRDWIDAIADCESRPSSEAFSDVKNGTNGYSWQSRSPSPIGNRWEDNHFFMDELNELEGSDDIAELSRHRN